MAFPITPFTCFVVPVFVFIFGAGFTALAVEWLIFETRPELEFRALFVELTGFLQNNRINIFSLTLNIALVIILLGLLPMQPPILVRRWSHVLNYLCSGALTGFLFVIVVETLLGFQEGVWVLIGVFTGIALSSFVCFVRHPE